MALAPESPSPFSTAAVTRWRGAPLSLALHVAALLLLWSLPPFDRSAGDPVVTVSIVADSPPPQKPPEQPGREAPLPPPVQTPKPAPLPSAQPRPAPSHAAPSHRPAAIAMPVTAPAATTEDRPAEVASPAAAQVTVEADIAAASAYGLAVWERIRQNRPLWARKFTGQALVAFAIARDGSLVSVDIARSSGSRRHDDAAVAAIRAAAPFPAPPAGGEGTLRFTIPFQFQ